MSDADLSCPYLLHLFSENIVELLMCLANTSANAHHGVGQLSAEQTHTCIINLIPHRQHYVISYTNYYPCRQSVGTGRVGCLTSSLSLLVFYFIICLSVYSQRLFFCLEHNSKTKYPKMFKLGIENDLGLI